MKCLTNHPVSNEAVDKGGQQSVWQNITGDLAEEIHRCTIESIGALVQEEFTLVYKQIKCRHRHKYLIHNDEEYHSKSETQHRRAIVFLIVLFCIPLFGERLKTRRTFSGPRWTYCVNLMRQVSWLTYCVPCRPPVSLL